MNSVGSMFCSQCAAGLGGAHAMPMPVQQQSNATVIFVLGILSLVVCAALGPVAWSMGKTELRKIEMGEAPREGHGFTNAGMICGIIGTILLAITAVMLIAWFAMFASMSGGRF